MKAHIFDMDGLLINSEPFWREAEIAIFTAQGIDFTEDMCLQTVGMRIDEVVAYWNQKLNITLPIKSTAERIQEEVIRLVSQDGAPLPGVVATLDELKKSKRKIALASSSNMKVIDAVLNKLKLKSYFVVIHSAEFEKYGKPHPDVFLTAAKKMKIAPADCIVYEDSRNGLLSGLRAGMKVVLIPEDLDSQKNWFAQASLQLKSLLAFNIETIESLS